MRNVNFIDLGYIDYQQAYQKQLELVRQRQQGEIPDTVLLLEHLPVITAGHNARIENLLVSQEVLKEQGIKFVKTDRGGDITFHGPGQLVIYPIVDLRTYGFNLRAYIWLLEDIIIRSLKEYGVDASRRDKMPGVFIDDKKIASIGIRLSRWVSYHGIAFNVNVDLRYFELIVPCGVKGMKMTSLSQITNRIYDMREVKETVIKAWQSSKLFC